LAEVVEIMMAKNPKKRYSTMDELIEDLEAVKKGDPPLLARQKFDMAQFEQLEEGMPVEDPYYEQSEKTYGEETITKYKVGLVMLGSLCLVLIFIIIYLAGRS
jgi:hypothetical protein